VLEAPRSIEVYLGPAQRHPPVAFERFPSDADASVEIQRLYSAASVIRALARYYLKTVYMLSDSYFSDVAS
jgi:hypothetical protein